MTSISGDEWTFIIFTGIIAFTALAAACAFLYSDYRMHKLGFVYVRTRREGGQVTVTGDWVKADAIREEIR